MSRRVTVALLGTALVTAMAGPRPGAAQDVAPPRLTVTRVANPATDELFGVSFPDPMHGYVSALRTHLIYATIDGGQTWQLQQTPLEVRPFNRAEPANAGGSGGFWELQFVDADHGYAVSSADAVIATSDGGKTWQLRPTPRPLEVRQHWPKGVPSGWQFRALSFVGKDTGYVVGGQGVILKTTDGGSTWSYQGDPIYGTLNDVDFVDEESGQIAGTVIGPDDEAYLTLATLDGGSTWSRQRTGKPDDPDIPLNLQTVTVLEPRRAVVAGTSGRIFVTFDSGATWRSRRSGTLERLNAVAFADRRRGLAVGDIAFPDESRAVILATNDGGQTWYQRPTPESAALNGVTFADATTAYAVGCATPTAPCTEASVLRIDFPELDLPVEQPSSGFSLLPLVLVGAAIVIVGGGILLARRR